MKEYSKEERKEIIENINELQKFIHKFKQEYGIEPSTEEILKGTNITVERLEELNSVLAELEEQDKELEFSSKKHTAEERERARQIRHNKTILRNIQKDIKGE